VAKLTARLDDRIGTISPMLYGHFAEHLGRCIYEGLWVGEDSPIPNTRGVRNDTVAALRKLAAPVIRWPGGCFADDYHWRDGIGPRDERPRRLNIWWHDEESNQFGTHEFIDLCRQAGAAPYICLNVGSGTPEEAAAWVEYSNCARNTSRAQERGLNGSPEPFAVRYWGVGNENWGCGGRFDPDDYAREYRRFACYLRGRSSSPIELIACGHTGPDWNPAATRGRTGIAGSSTPCATWARSTTCRSTATTSAATPWTSPTPSTTTSIPARSRSRPTSWRPRPPSRSTTARRRRSASSSMSGACGIPRHAATAASISATPSATRSPAPPSSTPSTVGNASVRVDLDDVPTVAAREGDGREVALPVVSASASVDEAGKAAVLTFQNLHLTEPCDCRIRLRGGSIAKASGKLLTARDVRDCNGPDAPRKVRPKRLKLDPKATTLRVELPPHALASVRIGLR